MTEYEYLTDLALAVQALLRDDPKHLIAASPRAKRLLADVTEAMRLWENWTEDNVQHEATVLVCAFCNAEVVMARLQDEEDPVAFECEPVLASNLPPSFNYQLTFDGNLPQVNVNLGLRTGTVWIRHELACGILRKPGVNSSIYRRRHARNVSTLGVALNNVSASLRLKLRHLHESAEDLRHDND